MRVLLFDHTAQLGGGEIALYDLVRFFDRTRVEPIVVLGSEGPLADKLRGLCELHILPIDAEVLQTRKDSLGAGSLMQFGKVTFVLGYIRRLMRFLREHRIAAIHTNSLKADILGGIAGRLTGTPVIWHIRDRIAPDYLPSKAVFLMRRLARILPSYVLANSAATLLTVELNGKVPGRAVASGVDMANFAANPAPSPPPYPLIGIVGRLCPWKGQHIFLEAARLVLQSRPDARFQIIGAALFQEQFYEEELRQQAQSLEITDSVEFTGFRSDVNLLIQRLSILVHASTTGEPFGQVIVQGMAAAKPVVATNGGGVPEIVQDGTTGYLVPMGDAPAMAQAILKLLAEPATATAMGLRGRQRILDHFTIESSARTVEDVYKQVAAPPR